MTGESRAAVREALISIGAESRLVDDLVSSRELERITIPIYSGLGVTADSHDFSLAKLPEFLKWFENEFPNGEVRWDRDYEPEPGQHFFAVRVIFNLKEDDQSVRVKVAPTILEEQEFQRKIREFSNTKPDSVKAHAIVSTISE